VDSVVLHITLAKDLLVRERRRYFPHAVNLPVVLREGEADFRGRITKLSEGNMTVHPTEPLKRSTPSSSLSGYPSGHASKARAT